MLAGYSTLVQVVAFVPAYIFHTEKYFDFTGGVTFISLTLIATLSNPSP